MTVTPVLTQPIAGPFTATWAPITYSGTTGTAGTAATLGLIGARGIREIRRHETEEVPADLLGNSVVDAVHLGMQLFLEFELEEANLLAVQAICHPFASSIDTLANLLSKEGDLGIPGTFQSFTGAGQVVLTPGFSTNNSAGAQLTPTRTYGLVTIAPGFEFNQLLSSRRRIVPLRLRCLPYVVSSRYVFYTKS